MHQVTSMQWQSGESYRKCAAYAATTSPAFCTHQVLWSGGTGARGPVGKAPHSCATQHSAAPKRPEGRTTKIAGREIAVVRHPYKEEKQANGPCTNQSNSDPTSGKGGESNVVADLLQHQARHLRPCATVDSAWLAAEGHRFPTTFWNTHDTSIVPSTLTRHRGPSGEVRRTTDLETTQWSAGSNGTSGCARSLRLPHHPPRHQNLTGMVPAKPHVQDWQRTGNHMTRKSGPSNGHGSLGDNR